MFRRTVILNGNVSCVFRYTAIWDCRLVHDRVHVDLWHIPTGFLLYIYDSSTY